MSFFDGIGLRDWKRAIPVVLAAALVLAGGMTVFTSLAPEPGYSVAYAEGGAVDEVDRIEGLIKLLKAESERDARNRDEIRRLENELVRAKEAVWKDDISRRYLAKLNEKLKKYRNDLAALVKADEAATAAAQALVKATTDDTEKQNALTDLKDPLEKADEAASVAAKALVTATKNLEDANKGEDQNKIKTAQAAFDTATNDNTEKQNALTDLKEPLAKAEKAATVAAKALVKATTDDTEKQNALAALKAPLENAENAASAAAEALVKAINEDNAKKNDLSRLTGNRSVKAKAADLNGSIGETLTSIQLEEAAVAAAKSKGGIDLYFVLVLLVVIACTVFGIVLERNYRKNHAEQAREVERLEREKQEALQLQLQAQSTAAKVLDWEKVAEGAGPKLVQLDVEVMSQLAGDRDLNENLKTAFNKLAQETIKSQRETRDELKKVGLSAEIAKEHAQGQEEDLSRYKDGYNWAGKKTFIRGVLKVIELISEMKSSETDAAQSLDSARDQLLYLLEMNDIEGFEPPEGELFNDHKKRGSATESDIEGHRPPRGGEENGQIVEVVSPGYRLELAVEGDEYKIIQPAKVIVAKAEVEPVEEPEEEQGKEEAPDEPGEELAQESEETTDETEEGNES